MIKTLTDSVVYLQTLEQQCPINYDNISSKHKKKEWKYIKLIQIKSNSKRKCIEVKVYLVQEQMISFDKW